ncbi:hypothetical protein K1T35_48530 (plasmid) [Pseudonocardia sp. DSM 110487]|uniref:hypothetical protein n=1 Tax=Pseudonocardia sp. DSM 110487 TaxID=2865833 RepID=UPI001C69EF8C|nr:hypothetical protein [Pseudonocardia sp. DSM 110487]QYN41195.1 hypothetical protein K1T35_48530 [Pseudonocardia sp. DSM 110487]
MTGRRIRLGREPTIPEPARRAFVLALRDLLENSRFGSLAELGDSLRPRRTKQRLSEPARGTRLPDVDELKAIVEACRPGAWPKLLQLLLRAEAEESAADADRTAVLSRLSDHAVTIDGRLPVVEEYRDWVRLGVHRPITRVSSGLDLTDRVQAGGLPTYVERERDRTELRPALAAAARGEGPSVRLVLVTGASLAGKTRAAVEAMRAELIGWRLLIPRSARSLAQLLDRDFNVRHTVVWLDEVQDLVRQDRGAEQLERLLDRDTGPTVLLATLRADREEVLRGTAAERLFQRAAPRITLYRRPAGEEFEQELARARTHSDPWLVEALDRIGARYGIAEWLAAGPQLVDQLDRARASDDPVKQTAAALVDAAIDCYHAGYTRPIPEPLLLAARDLYLPEHLRYVTHSVTADALEWARKPVAGASALLEPHTGWGDRAFDYLVGAATENPAAAVHAGIWQLLPAHLTPGTSELVTRAAYRAGQSALAHTLIPRLHHQARARLYAEMGDVESLTAMAETNGLWWGNAASLLAELLAKRGDIPALTARAAAGHSRAAYLLVELLAERRDITALTARADAGDRWAPGRLAVLLAERGDIPALTARAEAGDVHAGAELAKLGDFKVLTEWADAGSSLAAAELAELLAERGDLDTLTARADAGDWDATALLAGLLAERGDIPGLTARADAGDRWAAGRLAVLLAERGDIPALTARAEAGDARAGVELAKLGDFKVLTARADAGDEEAAERLTELLAERGDVDTLTERADAGDRRAAGRLPWLLAERGDLRALTVLADARHEEAARRLARLLAERGDFDALTARAAAGDQHALWELAGPDNLEALTKLADFDEGAALRLAELLAERGDIPALTARANADDWDAARVLDELLAERGDIPALTARADAGDQHAAERLAELLVLRGELHRRPDLARRFG